MNILIDDQKVRAIVNTDDGKRYTLTEREVRDFCTYADWAEGAAHLKGLGKFLPPQQKPLRVEGLYYARA